MHDDSPPTISERYGSAIRSSHLEAKSSLRLEDIDRIIAAGWVRDTLGANLVRLRLEWDGARASYLQARESASEWAAELRNIDRRERNATAAWVGPEPGTQPREPLTPVQASQWLNIAKLRAMRRELERRIEGSIKTAMALTMMDLRTLRPTRDALGLYAWRQATFRRLMRPDHVVLMIAGRALEAWIDPNCGYCEGRGTVGAEPVTICRYCHGSGKRRVRFGSEQPDNDFGHWLLSEMDRKVYLCERHMRHLLARRALAPTESAGHEVEALRDRLRGLRSAEAQED